MMSIRTARKGGRVNMIIINDNLMFCENSAKHPNTLQVYYDAYFPFIKYLQTPPSTTVSLYHSIVNLSIKFSAFKHQQRRLRLMWLSWSCKYLLRISTFFDSATRQFQTAGREARHGQWRFDCIVNLYLKFSASTVEPPWWSLLHFLGWSCKYSLRISKCILDNSMK